ncbi:MAG: hypothetical protein NDI73_05510 [Desulfuromonadales bacterium]|nr:hypothetical protein [Desulfuromonadales bacterium]
MRRQENSDLKVIINSPSLLRRSAKLPQVVRFVPANPLARPAVAQKYRHLDRPSRTAPVAQIDRFLSVFASAENGVFSRNNNRSSVLKLHYTQLLSTARKRVTAQESLHAFPFE